MFNFSVRSTGPGGALTNVIDREPGEKGPRGTPGEPKPPAPLPESPAPSPVSSPVEQPGSPSPGSGRGSPTDTGAAGGTSATPVAAGSFARPGLAPQMAAFNTLAPVSKLQPRGGPGTAPIAGSNTFDQPSSPTSVLDDLLRKLGLVQ